jgi:hypothetical protein
MTAGNGSQSTSTSSAASSATYRLSASTRATWSPTNRASSSASGGSGVVGIVGPSMVNHCSRTSGLRSAAVNTACTPSSASAADTSIPRIAARGNGLRTKQACSIRGRTTSST